MKHCLIGGVSLLTVLLTAAPLSAQDKNGNSEWEFSLSAGSFLSPTFPGADSYQVSAFPDVRISYGDRFSFSFNGAEYNLVKTDNWRVAPVGRFNFGRDEDGSNPLCFVCDDTSDLVGLNEVDFTIEFGGLVEYSFGAFSVKAEARQGVNGHDGFIADFELNYSGRLSIAGRQSFYSFGPKLTFVDNNYNSAFFDVTAAEALVSGLSEFDADGGLQSYGVQASLVVPISDRFSLIGFAGYDRLTGDAADSSLVIERGSPNQAEAGLFLSYRF